MLVAAIVVLVPLVSTASHLALPTPVGPYAIGRLRLSWSDPARREVLSANNVDQREIIAEVWYPARSGTGSAAPYFPDLARVAAGLIQSGEFDRFETWGLRFVRAHGRTNAVAAEMATFPVVILSPGGATNAEFYASFAEDLASNGFVVFALNHPYDVAAVTLANGSVAVLADQGPPNLDSTASRIAERVADVRFLLDRLGEINGGSGPLAQHLDLARIGAMGHSLGGITAAQACAAEARLKACLNLDGLQDGGPFSVRSGGPIPTQPFKFITKETTLAPRLEELLRGVPNFSRTIIPDAAHRDFSDGPLFEPSLLPLSRTIDRVNAQIRGAIREFFQQTLVAR